MKRTILLFLAGIALISVVGCSSEDNTTTGGKKTALNVSSASIQAATRGVFDSGGTLTGGSIGIYSFGSGYSDANLRYSYGTPYWSADNASKTIYLTGKSATLLAYSPYSSSFSLTSAPLTAGIYSETNDLCVGTVSVINNLNPSAGFTLGHVYSRITLSINTSYSGACNITGVVISGSAIYTSAVANLTPSAYPVLSGKTTGTVSLNPDITSLTAGTSVVESFLMIPAATEEFTGATTITFTVNGTAQRVILPASDPATTTGINALTAGQNYLITVLVQPTGLTVNSVTVNSWDSGTSSTLYPSATGA